VAAGPGGARRIIAIVSVGGFQRSILDVGRFRAPAPGLPRVTGARYRVAHGRLALSWSRVHGAGSYTVTVRLGGGVRSYRIEGRATRATFPLPAGAKLRGVRISATVGAITGPAVAAGKQGAARKRHRRKRRHKHR
jgi:hypothetical protein